MANQSSNQSMRKCTFLSLNTKWVATWCWLRTVEVCGNISSCLWSDKYKDHSKITDTPSSWAKMKYLFLNLKFNHFKVFTLGIQSFLIPFQPRPEERENVNFWKDPQLRLYTTSSTSLQVKTAIPCVLSLDFENKENSTWTDDQVKVGKEIVESR